MNFLTKNNFFLLILSAVFMFSCSKDDVGNNELTTAEIKNTILAEEFTEDINNILEYDHNIFTGKLSEKSDECFLRTSFSIDSNDGVILDFGSGCTSFGKRLSGKLKIKYVPLVLGYSKEVSFENFTINDHKIMGSVFSKKGLINERNNPYINFDFDFRVEFSSGEVISRKGSWSKEKTEGVYTLLNLHDDLYQTTGGWESISFNGLTRSIRITKPLSRKSLVSCAFITEGTIEVEKAGSIYTIDFGNGDCNDTFTITDVNGEVKEYSFTELIYN